MTGDVFSLHHVWSNQLEFKLPIACPKTRMQNMLTTYRMTCAVTSLLLIGAVLFLALRLNHAPLSDDLSMIAYSSTMDLNWFRKGLADYFIVYPEFYSAQSNFVRPVSNFVYWMFNNLVVRGDPFLANILQLGFLTYGTLIACAIAVNTILKRVSRSRTIATLGTLSCLFIPTFWTTPTPSYTSFVFDGLSIVFCLFALMAWSNGRNVTMTFLLTLALLTKEISFPVIVGFTSIFALMRNRHAFGGCVMAIAIWVGLRLYAFGFHSEGVYVFGSGPIGLEDLFLDKLRNALTLPFGPVFFEQIVTSTGVEMFNRSGILLGLNFSIYFIVLFLVTKHIILDKKPNQGSRLFYNRAWSAEEAIKGIATSATVIAFVCDAYVGANYRYAYNLLPFLFIAFGGIRLPFLKKAALFTVLLSGCVVASSASIIHLVAGSEFELFRYQVVRDLFEKIRAHNKSKAIVVINDFVLGYANPHAVEILAQTESKLIRGTSLYLDNCHPSELSGVKTIIESSGPKVRISVTLPECGRFAFESSPKLPEFVASTTINRNEQIQYEFYPAADNNYASVPNWDGRNLTIVINNADILYFDFLDQTWKFISRLPVRSGAPHHNLPHGPERRFSGQPT